MKMFVGYAVRYVISLHEKSSESTILLCNRKVCQLSKDLPVASTKMNYVIIKETFSGRTF